MALKISFTSVSPDEMLSYVSAGVLLTSFLNSEFTFSQIEYFISKTNLIRQKQDITDALDALKLKEVIKETKGNKMVIEDKGVLINYIKKIFPG